MYIYIAPQYLLCCNATSMVNGDNNNKVLLLKSGGDQKGGEVVMSLLIYFIGFFVVSYCRDNNAIALPNPLSNYLDYSSDEPLLNPYIET